MSNEIKFGSLGARISDDADPSVQETGLDELVEAIGVPVARETDLPSPEEVAQVQADSPDVEQDAESCAVEEVAVEEQPEEDGLDELAKLMEYAAGTAQAPELSVQPSADAGSAFKDVVSVASTSMAASDPMDELVAAIQPSRMDVPRMVQASLSSDMHVPQDVEMPVQQPVARQQVAQGAPAVGGAAMQQQAVAPASNVADAAGRLIAGAISTPFFALSSAARHLKDRFGLRNGEAVPGASAGDGLQASMQGADMSPAIVNTLAKITDWKCTRIEKAAGSVMNAADGIMQTEEYELWHQAVQDAAKAHGVDPASVVEAMNEPEFREVKSLMDRCWENHPDEVAGYRDACKDFERNISNVVKSYRNSEPDVQQRVMNSMTDVQKKTGILPGFGDEFGDYTRSMADRIKELARMIAEFLQTLASKLTGGVVFERRATDRNDFTL